MFALLLQVLVPLAQPQAAWVEEGLFPPTCSIHHDTTADQSDVPDCGPCALCHAHGAQSLGALPDRMVSVAFDGTAVAVPIPQAAVVLPVGARVRPPLPSRGPPAAA